MEWEVRELEVCTGSNWSPNPARTRDRLTRPEWQQLNLEPEPDPYFVWTEDDAVQIMVIFCQLRLVSILSNVTLNQT